VAGAKKNVGREKEKPKTLQAAGITVPTQKTIVCYARENAASKSHLLGRWETQSAHRDPTFLLPSVCCRVLRSRVFIFFISKLENLAIKLVEIASEKQKIPNFFVKKGKFFLKKTMKFTV